MGDIRLHHFSHHEGGECTQAAETGIHLRAKEIIRERQGLCLPEERVTVTRAYQDQQVSATALVVKAGTFVRFSSVAVEQPEAGFQPDVTGYFKERKLFIEIRVTHAVDKHKQAKIAASGISCVEIDLSSIHRFATPDEIEAAINSTEKSAWVFHAQRQRKSKALYDSLEAEYQALIVQHQQMLAREKAARAAREAAREEEEREAQRKEQFKQKLREVGRLLSAQLMHYWIIPPDYQDGDICHQSLHDYNDVSNAAVIDVDIPARNMRERVAIAWTYKGASRFLLQYHRRLNLPYCAISIAPLVAQHRPPQHPLPAHVIEAFIAQTVVPALLAPSRWYIPPVWFEAYVRERQNQQALSEQRRREAKAREQERHYTVQLTQRLREDIETMERLVLTCRRQEEKIDAARDPTELSVSSRWAALSENKLTPVEQLEHITPENFYDQFQPLGFPYLYEWAYAEHPDFIKALVVDCLIGLDSTDTSLSTRRIESIYVTTLDRLARLGGQERARNNTWGASALAIEVRKAVEAIGSRLRHYQALADNNPDVSPDVRKIENAVRGFMEPRGRVISPSVGNTKRQFVALLCQDLTQLGMLAPEGVSGDNTSDDNVRYKLLRN